jgi:predicted NAD/FAD-binding protein
MDEDGCSKCAITVTITNTRHAKRKEPAMREQVAVIGAGIGGLTAAHLLQRRYDVTLFEANDRLGGHTHTHHVAVPGDGVISIDSGFIVFNDRTYPRLNRLFDELGVTSRATEMSMSIHCDGCGLEYAGGKGPSGVFAQSRSFGRPKFLRMLAEIRRFYRLAAAVAASDDDTLTLGGFLANGGFSDYFTQHFMVPVVSCVWSAASDVALEYPARYLFTFLDNHGMLSVSGSPAWRTVEGGSDTYVERVAAQLTAVVASTPVHSVIRHENGVEIRTDDGESAHFDRAVVATHADTALALLHDPTPEQSSTLGAFTYSENETWLHSDVRVLPDASRARSSWNYRLPACAAVPRQVPVSYDMNRLQGLDSRTPFVVTLNATDGIDSALVVERMRYQHPIYTRASVAAQRRLGTLNDATLAFAGAYHGWGFHEDGCLSGVNAARALGVEW